MNRCAICDSTDTVDTIDCGNPITHWVEHATKNSAGQKETLCNRCYEAISLEVGVIKKPEQCEVEILIENVESDRLIDDFTHIL